jgi:hypothetical protein
MAMEKWQNWNEATAGSVLVTVIMPFPDKNTKLLCVIQSNRMIGIVVFHLYSSPAAV